MKSDTVSYSFVYSDIIGLISTKKNRWTVPLSLPLLLIKETPVILLNKGGFKERKILLWTMKIVKFSKSKA